MRKDYRLFLPCVLLFACMVFLVVAQAQNAQDAIMMNKKQWCNGVRYERTQWNNYWEGTRKRDNANLGTFTSEALAAMTNYGITNNLNVMAAVPYVWNRTSAGTLHPVQGMQDIAVALKWKAYSTKWNNAQLSLLAVGSISTPTSRYVVDFLPLSIGLGSTNASGRAMVDFQQGKFFATASAAYMVRSNTQIDRNAYFTDHMIYANKVAMPNVANYQLRTGFRSRFLIAEALLTRTNTLGGFDIRRNDMPFPSNRMNLTQVGGHLKYTLPFYTHIELTADGGFVVKGRNVGQATTAGVGAFYLFTFNKPKETPSLQ